MRLADGTGATRKIHDGECQGNFCIKNKTKQNSQMNEINLTAWSPAITLGPVLSLELLSQVLFLRKHFSSGVCYWSHLSNRIAHHL